MLFENPAESASTLCEAMTSNSSATSEVVTPSDMASHTRSRLEIFAAYERHMQDRDALIASRIGCSAAYWANVRECNLPFWELMEQKAMQTPPRLRPSQLTSHRKERFAPGEYLRWSERSTGQANSLMHRACPTWLILGVMGFAALWFFVPAVFPHQAETLTDFLKGLFL